MAQADAEEREVVATLDAHWDARLLQGYLEANGVSAWISSRGADSVPDEALAAGGHQVMVRESDLDVARELVASGGAPDSSDADMEQRLADLLLELLAQPCVTGREHSLADWLADRSLERHEEVVRVGNSLMIGSLDDSRPTVLLVSHLDVVPPTDDDREPRAEGERIVGRGASDMKGGLAVAIDCLDDAALRAGPYNLVLVAYAGEEGPAEDNELPRLLEAVADLEDADLAVVLEPTDLEIQLGCLGGLHALVQVHGRAAHSARPWYGDNALTKAGGLLTWLHQREPREALVEGLTFREVLTATRAWTDNRRNVVPDCFTLNVNYRFAPNRTLDDAERDLGNLLAPFDVSIDVIDRAPPAPPASTDELVSAFVRLVAAPVRAKQAWTDVARFAEAGVPALNYGPGLAAQAHVRGEHIPRANLTEARVALARFLSATPAADDEDPNPESQA